MRSFRTGIESAVSTSRDAAIRAKESSREAYMHTKAQLRSAARWRQLFAVVCVVPLGLIVLMLLNAGLSYVIWGELVVAWAVLSFALYWLTHAPLTRRPFGWFGVPQLRVWQAFGWGLLIVVGLPLTWTFLWTSLVALIVPPIALWLFQRSFDRHETRLWGKLFAQLSFGVLVSVGFLLIHAIVWPKASVDDAEVATATAPLPQARLLAWRFRPALFFDSDEQFIPIDIEDAIDDNRIVGCDRGRLEQEEPEPEQCNTVENPKGFAHELDYITVGGGPLAGNQTVGGSNSAIYYHVTRRRTGRIFIDYWWYFVENPSPFAARALCGAALSWVPVICGKHPSDWEGITVVLGRCAEADGPAEGCFKTALGRRRVVEVHYAQHEHNYAYTWAQLQQTRAEYRRRIWHEIGPHRPWVFVARSSHASYRKPCGHLACGQTSRWFITESRDGLRPWTNNGDTCVRDIGTEEETATRVDCLKPLPLTDNGAPAQWSTYPGRWGAQKCVLSGAFCDGEQPPRGPAFQPRYKNPNAARRTS